MSADIIRTSVLTWETNKQNGIAGTVKQISITASQFIGI